MSKRTGIFLEPNQKELIIELHNERGPRDWLVAQLVYKYAIESGLDSDFYYTVILSTGEFIQTGPHYPGFKDSPAPHTLNAHLNNKE